MNLAPVNRVLLTTDTLGGVWTFAQELSESLASFGVEVLLVCLGGRLSSEQRVAVAGLPNITLEESEYKLEWMHDPWVDVAASGDWLLDWQNDSSPTSSISTHSAMGRSRWQVPALLTAHSCVLSWWMAVRKEAAPAEWNRYRDLVERSISSADGITAPSKAMLDCLHRHYRASTQEFRVIPNGRGRSIPTARRRSLSFWRPDGFGTMRKTLPPSNEFPRGLSWPCFVCGRQPRIRMVRAGRFRGCEMLGQARARASFRLVCACCHLRAPGPL